MSILVDTDKAEPGMRVVKELPDSDKPCPVCGEDTLFFGFGLAGGGFGGYVSCDHCGVFFKVMQNSDDE